MSTVPSAVPHKHRTFGIGGLQAALNCVRGKVTHLTLCKLCSLKVRIRVSDGLRSGTVLLVKGSDYRADFTLWKLSVTGFGGRTGGGKRPSEKQVFCFQTAFLRRRPPRPLSETVFSHRQTRQTNSRRRKRRPLPLPLRR